MEATHPKFSKYLKASEPTRWMIAQWLSSRGHIVRIPPLRVAPTHAEASEYSDEGDLEICERIEVKRLSAVFTCRKDWPFPDFMVCNKRSFDKANPKPLAYIIVNKAGTHAGIVVVKKSRDKWTEDLRRDGRFVGHDVKDVFYITTLDLVDFIELK